MKKLMVVLLVWVGLTLSTVAGAQNFSVSIRSWDLLVFEVEGEFHAMPHLSLAVGVGSEVLNFSTVEIFGGVAYFNNPDNSGLYGAGRFVLGFMTRSIPYVSPLTGLVTTGGYRWRPDPSTQLDVELGMFWRIPSGGAFPLLSLGFGYRF